MTYGERSDRVLMPFECGDLIRQRLLSAGATPTAAAPTPVPTAALPTATAEGMSAIPRASLTPALPEHVSARCGVTPTRGGGKYDAGALSPSYRAAKGRTSKCLLVALRTQVREPAPPTPGSNT